jgi:hypothetical protein
MFGKISKHLKIKTGTKVKYLPFKKFPISWLKPTLYRGSHPFFRRK